MQKTTLGSRLREIRSHLGLTQTAMAELIGRNLRTYQHYERDENSPSYEVLRPIFEKDPQLEIVWLIGGQGDMLRPEKKKETEHARPVKLYDVKASAGKGTINPGFPVEMEMILPWRWLKDRARTDGQQLAAVFVEGDSMEPTIPHRAIVIYNREPGLRDGKIYVVRLGDELFVKRLFALKGKPGCELRSDNKVYDSIIVRADGRYMDEESEIKGRVVAIVDPDFDRHVKAT